MALDVLKRSNLVFRVLLLSALVGTICFKYLLRVVDDQAINIIIKGAEGTRVAPGAIQAASLRSWPLIAEKLRGFPDVHLLTLGNPERLSVAAKNLANANLRTIFANGVRGSNETLCQSLAVYNRSHFKSSGELGCSLGHLEAIRNFYMSRPEEEYAVIVEDDFSFESVPFWLESWSTYFNRIPSDFSIVQLIMTSARGSRISNGSVLHPFPMPRRPGIDTGAAAYLISRKGAERVLEKYLLPDGRWNLSEASIVPGAPGRPRNMRPVADFVIYDIDGPALRWPLFTPTTANFKSTIFPRDRPGKWHTPAAQIQLEAWQSNPI